MNHFSRGFLGLTGFAALSACAFLPAASLAQTSAKSDQWIHVRVESKDNKGETVHVNLPVEMAEKLLPAIKNEHLNAGKVRIDSAKLDNVDLRAMLDAIRTSKDGEYVTVQSNENNVRVAKMAGYLYIHVTENESHEKAAGKSAAKDSAKDTKVEIKIPMKVVDALFSAGKDELDVVAALHVLSSNGDTELVNVKGNENTVRIWIDTKNIAD